MRERDDDAARVTCVATLHEAVFVPLRPGLQAFAAAVLLVLLIACANLGSLLFARLGAREQELAVRLTLGAGRARIARQLLTESLLLAAAGGIAGLAVAWASLRLLIAAAPAELPGIAGAALNPRGLLFTAATSILAGLAFGVIPGAAQPPQAGAGLARTRQYRHARNPACARLPCRRRSRARRAPDGGRQPADPQRRRTDGGGAGLRAGAAAHRGSARAAGGAAGACGCAAHTSARPGYFETMGIPLQQGRSFSREKYITPLRSGIVFGKPAVTNF